MTTEFILAEALKKMMALQPLEQITVKALVEKCDITRPTFYYHFHDIYDLLAWIFLNEKIEGIDKAASWQEAILKIGRYCVTNRSLVRQTHESAGRDLLIEFLNNNLYVFHLRAIETIDVQKRIDIDDRKRLALFYSAALNAVLLDWIRSNMKEPLLAITERLSPLVGNYLEPLIKEQIYENV